MGLVDPIKLFVKNEPHKISKLLENRQRLIFSVSLIDNTVARVLHQIQNSMEKNEWESIPVKSGMGLHDEGLEAINRCIRVAHDSGVKLREADISGWDFSFQEWDFKEDLELRLSLNKGYGTVWHKIALAHHMCMANKVMVFSDGSMVQQTVGGLMPSGWFLTASTNSHQRVENSYHLQIQAGVKPWCVAMGDDSVENEVQDASLKYEKILGKRCKMYKEAYPASFEFCSTRFDGVLGIPCNVDKQLYAFLCNPCSTWALAESRYYQFCYELRNHPDLERLKDIINASSWWSNSPEAGDDEWLPLE